MAYLISKPQLFTYDSLDLNSSVFTDIMKLQMIIMEIKCHLETQAVQNP